MTAGVPLSIDTNALILCIIDLTDASRDTLQTAIHQAEFYKAKLTVLYPYRLTQLGNSGDDVSQIRKSIDANASQSFSKISKELLKNSDVDLEFRSEVGFMNDRVHAFSKKNKIGLMVMSKKMALSNRDAFNDLLDQIQVPLLIVPQTETIKS